MSGDATHAWVHLTRLCGCNYSVKIKRTGQSVIVPDPQIEGKRYRLSAAQFDVGKRQFRDGWCIEPWTQHAADVTAREEDWQD